MNCVFAKVELFFYYSFIEDRCHLQRSTNFPIQQLKSNKTIGKCS